MVIFLLKLEMDRKIESWGKRNLLRKTVWKTGIKIYQKHK